MEKLLEVSSIDVFYGSIQALRGVSLRVETGERVALLGPNGAGKTTTLRTISGLLHPSSGVISLNDSPIHNLPPHEIVRLGVVQLPEGRDLFPTLTVEENLRFGYITRRKDKSGYVDALDSAFERFPRLKERRRQAAGTLSGGEQQMLGISRALMSNPTLLMVDELSLGLAPIIVEQLFDILADVNREGTSILIVEQFVHMALAHTDRAYVLSKGQIVLQDTSKSLESDPDLVASYLGDTEISEVSEEKTPARTKRSSSKTKSTGKV